MKTHQLILKTTLSPLGGEGGEPKILVIDNYDSFVYNLVHYLREFGCEVDVVRNDKVKFNEISNYDKILLSPGPGIPSEAGMLMQVIKKFAGKKSILGVCLGHQAIGEHFGGKLKNMKKVYHGVAENLIIEDESEYLFKNIPSQIKVGRYHSWIVENNLPDCLVVTAVDEEGKIMALKHKEYDIRGVQFHPESVLTEYGKEMIKNWIGGAK